MMMMGETSKTSTTTTDNDSSINPSVFHDFLASKVPNLLIPSEKQVDCQFERISGYGLRNDPSVSEISNQFSGNNRNHTDSDQMGSSRERVPQITCDRSNAMKMFGNASGGERPRMSPYDRPLHGSPQNRPVSATFMTQQNAWAIAKLPNYERSISMNLGGGSNSLHHNPHIGQASPSMYQSPSSRFREGGSCPAVLSQLAADEGSRTGNKSSVILKAFNPSNSLVSERNLSGLVPGGFNVNPMTSTYEPESSTSLGRHGLIPSSRQMTIIFGGQLHVFDDVNPNKADVIMALAGSNGGCWSTTLTKSSVREPTKGSCLPTREANTSSACDRSLPLKYDSKLFSSGSFIHGVPSLSSYKGWQINKEEFMLEAKKEA